MVFGDISNSNNTNDFLPIFNSVILVELFIVLAAFSFLKSDTLKKWYSDYKLSALIADVLIIIIGFIIARALYSKIFNEFNIFKFLLLILAIQIIHDIILYFAVIKPFPRGSNEIIDLFKDYSDAVSYKAIIGDSVLIILSVFFASIFKNYSNNANIIMIILSIYFLVYIVYTK